MGSQDPVVCTDPQEPGAPQVGDLVVVADRSAPGWHTLDAHLVGQVGRLDGVWVPPGSRTDDWKMREVHPWDIREIPYYIHAVRRPTEAELAAWAIGQTLGQPDGGLP